MKNKTFKIATTVGTLATVVAPTAAVVSCGSDSLDLTKNIVVLAPVDKDANGNITRPMKEVWDEAIRLFKEDHPEEAAKYNIVVKELPFEQWDNLGTLGVNSDSVPDVWYFPSDMTYRLNNDNGALAKMSTSAKKLILDAVNKKAADEGSKITKLTLEVGKDASGIDTDYGVRYKNESEMMWVNFERLEMLYPKALDAFRAISATPDNFLPTPTADDTVGEWVDKFIAANGGTDNFDEFHKAMAKLLYKNIDAKKIADVMKADTDPTSLIHDLMPVPGENGWPLNGFIYSVGNPTEGGLQWREGQKSDGDQHSIFMDINQSGPKDVLSAWFDLAKNGPKRQLNTWNDFANGKMALTIEGSWAQKHFTEDGKDAGGQTAAIKDTKNRLFAFPLSQVAGKQMRHYEQGWNFGINARNKVDGEKYTATAELISELFTSEVQSIYYTKRENYVPININKTAESAMVQGDQWIKGPLEIISNEGSTLKVDRGTIPTSYYKDDFDHKYGKILEVLKADDSGNIVPKNADEWLEQAKNSLESEGFKTSTFNYR